MELKEGGWRAGVGGKRSRLVGLGVLAGLRISASSDFACDVAGQQTNLR